METQKIVYGVFREVFNLPDLDLKDSMSTGDIDGWDSFKNVEILINCESKFNIEFDANEIDSIGTISDLILTINKKIIS